MPGATTLLLLVLVSTPAPTLSSPPSMSPLLLLGLQSGISTTGLRSISSGPTAGISAEISLFRHLAVQAMLEQSLHWAEQPQVSMGLPLTATALSVQYRLDIAQAIPYAGAGIRFGRMQLSKQDHVDLLTGGVGLGLLLPLGTQWFAGAELRYGYEFISGAFPHSRSLLLRIGWRSGSF